MHHPFLHNGKGERLKAATHGVALGTALLCATYNLGAWIVRRQRHLGVNALLYTAAVFWEAEHVRHHLAAIPMRRVDPVRPSDHVRVA